jgi:hypothetical protein
MISSGLRPELEVKHVVHLRLKHVFEVEGFAA